MDTLDGYLRTLDRVIDLLNNSKGSEANLVMSNFFFSKEALEEIDSKELQKDLLRLTLHHRHFVEASQDVKSDVVLSLYLVGKLPTTGQIYIEKDDKSKCFIIVEKDSD